MHKSQMKSTNVCTNIPDGRTNWIDARDLSKKQRNVCTSVPDGRTTWIDARNLSKKDTNERMYNRTGWEDKLD